jgi:hypothetical protein
MIKLEYRFENEPKSYTIQYDEIKIKLNKNELSDLHRQITNMFHQEQEGGREEGIEEEKE